MATQIFEAVIDENGVLRFTEPFQVPHGTKVMMTIDFPDDTPSEFLLPEPTSDFAYRLCPFPSDPSQAYLYYVRTTDAETICIQR